MLTEELINKLHKEAVKVRGNSYSPYSNFSVGAAMCFDGDSQIYSGCNFENISFPAGNCAEYSAMGSAVSAKGKQTLRAVVVVTKKEEGTPPCGVCLQMMSEFSDEDTTIYMATNDKIIKQAKLFELLPTQFKEL